MFKIVSQELVEILKTFKILIISYVLMCVFCICCLQDISF